MGANFSINVYLWCSRDFINFPEGALKINTILQVYV